MARSTARPPSSAQYVALGSSFAAGIGLGPRAPGSPCGCQRSVNGYPPRLARLAGLSLVDVTCSGASTRHVLRDRQFLQPPQIEAVGPGAKLVTLTIGGNDVGYIGDLTMLAFRRRGGLAGLLLRRFWKGPRRGPARDFARLQDDISAILADVGRRAPGARTVVVAYPAILPRAGCCSKVGLDDDEAALMRDVAARLAEATRAAAEASGAILIDMSKDSVGHDACAEAPWTNGLAPAEGAPFHPTADGAEAMARLVLEHLVRAGERFQ